MFLIVYLWLKFLFWVVLLPLRPVFWVSGIKSCGLLVATVMLMGLVHEFDMVGRFNRVAERYKQEKTRVWTHMVPTSRCTIGSYAGHAKGSGTTWLRNWPQPVARL